jgi:hypothetical protein
MCSRVNPLRLDRGVVDFGFQDSIVPGVAQIDSRPGNHCAADIMTFGKSLQYASRCPRLYYFEN